MKKDIHPQVNTGITVSCVCGYSFVTDSTEDKITVEICSNCHPFYTGQQKFVDTEGRIDKFEKKIKLSESKKKAYQEKKAKKAEKENKETTTTNTDRPSLKDMLQQAKSQQ